MVASRRRGAPTDGSLAGGARYDAGMALDLLGLMVATVTPFTAGGREVDLDWIPVHLRFLEGAGMSAVLPLGTNGEGPSVGLAERRQVVETVVRHKGSLGVVAGAGTPSLVDTIRAANEALDAGADAVALLPPYFYADVDAAGLVDYFSGVIEALPSAGKVLLYNIPSKARIDIPDEVVLALLELHGDQVLGIKDSSGDVERTRRYLELSADCAHFAVLAGADSRHAALYAAGCVGGVSGLANAVPSLVKAIQVTAQGGGNAARAQAQLDRLRAALKPFPAMGALKQLLTITSGLPLTHTRPPQRDLNPEEQRALERAVAGYLLSE